MVEQCLIPRDYQVADIQKVVKASGVGLIVAAPGSGKTLTCVESMLQLPTSTVLIIAPPRTFRSAWLKTLNSQIMNRAPELPPIISDATLAGLSSSTGEFPLRVLGSDKEGRQNFSDLRHKIPGVYIASWQWFVRQDFKGVIPDMVIADEVHIAGNYKGKTRKALWKLKSRMRIAVSGTPFRNHWENSFAVVKWLQPELITRTFWEWRIADCETVYDHFAPGHVRVIGEREPGKLLRSLNCYVYHAAREECCIFHPEGFLAHLPESLTVTREIELTAGQRKFYKQMIEDQVAWLTTPDAEGRVPVVAQLPIVARSMRRAVGLAMPSLDEETGRLYFKEDAPSPRADEVIRILTDEFPDEQVVVYSHSKQFIKLLVPRLKKAGISAEPYTGDESHAERDDVIRRFSTGETRVIAGVITAMAEGLDGIQNHSNVAIFASLSDDATAMEQVYARQDRLGQKNRVVKIILEAPDTTDAGVLDETTKRALQMNKAMRLNQ